MKKILTFAAVAVFALSMASCQTCYDCAGGTFFGVTLPDEEVCSGDGASKQDVEDAVAALEALGYSCTKS
jgi:hypothetical protein